MASPRPTPHSISPTQPAPQRQLSIAFESPLLQGMTPTERAKALMFLTNLLLLAAGFQTEDSDHDAS